MAIGENAHMPRPPREIVVRIVELGALETHHMFTATRSQPLYHLLTKNGEYMYLGGSDDPITSTSWAQAQVLYRVNGAAYLFSLHEREAHFFYSPNTEGVGSWMRAALYPHDSFKQHRNVTILVGEQYEKKKRPSGAQNRKRYGTPPSRKR